MCCPVWPNGSLVSKRPIPTFRDYSVAAVAEAIQTVVGWTAVILTTSAVGLWLGMSIASGDFVTLRDLSFVVMVLPVAWLVNPIFAVPVAVMAVAWYLPLKIESGSLMIAAVCVNFATWLLITLSI